MASVTWVEMTAPSLLLGGLYLVVGRDIRQVNRYPLKARWSTVLTETNYVLYSQKLSNSELFQLTQSLRPLA